VCIYPVCIFTVHWRSGKVHPGAATTDVSPVLGDLCTIALYLVKIKQDHIVCPSSAYMHGTALLALMWSHHHA
jgi:hypothetical protein